MIRSNREVKNAGWIVGCKVIQSVIMFVIGMISARYLGPSNYGLINYASSLVAFALPIMQLGLSSTLVKDLVDNPDKEGTILGTSLVFNIIASVFTIIGIVSFVYLSNADERDTTIVCFLYSISLIFQATEMIRYWFQAKLMSKVPSLATLIGYSVVSLYKVFLLVTEKNIYWFAMSHVIEYLITSVILIVIYYKIGKDRFSFSFSLGKKMLSSSKYYIISGIMVTVFQQTDRIMLKHMLGDASTGFYSAAITCVGIAGFVYMAIIDSARPSILKSKKLSEDEYKNKIIVLYSIITIISLLQSVVMTIFAKPIVLLLYGTEYCPAIPVLRIAVWYSTFGYYGVVRNIWILGEGKQKLLLVINIIAASVNVGLNALLIPLLGENGAAIASLITQLFGNFVLCFLLKSLRPCGTMIIKSLNPKCLLRWLKAQRQ